MTRLQAFLMEVHTALMLLAAGVIGGTISALAGGASLVLFPAMLAAGVPPLMAVASNSTGMMPGSFLAAMADRSQLPKLDRSFIVLLAVSLVAATGGAILLIVTPERAFELLVPLLLGLGTVLVAYAQPIGTWLGQLSRTHCASSATASRGTAIETSSSSFFIIVWPPARPHNAKAFNGTVTRTMHSFCHWSS
jgi:uncharacterized protein